MMDEDKPLADRIKAKAAELGFAACGIARADAAPRAAERLRAVACRGRARRHDLDGGARRISATRPPALWPEVRSVIALGMSYAPGRRSAGAGGRSSDRGRISVYAQGGDYHDVVKRALKALARWLVAEAPAAT